MNDKIILFKPFPSKGAIKGSVQGKVEMVSSVCGRNFKINHHNVPYDRMILNAGVGAGVGMGVEIAGSWSHDSM